MECENIWFIFQQSPPFILKVKKVLDGRYDLIIALILFPSHTLFSSLKTDDAKSGEYGRWSINSKPQLCTAAIAITDWCAGHWVLLDSCNFLMCFHCVDCFFVSGSSDRLNTHPWLGNVQ